MDTKTIQRLANITTSFYQKTASDFSASRNQSWQGWNNLVSLITPLQKEPIRVLDIACGNGRFAHFLSEKFPNKKLVYVGIDNNKQLLQDASKQPVNINVTVQLHTIDIIEKLLENKKLIEDEGSFDIIVAFGIMHHIPSKKLREQFFSSLGQHLAKDGYWITTFWDFINTKRLDKKQVDPQLLGLDEKKLESGDYILDWQRGTAALRYTNHTTLAERYRLAKKSGLKLTNEFRADGKEHNLNHYLVLQK